MKPSSSERDYDSSETDRDGCIRLQPPNSRSLERKFSRKYLTRDQRFLNRTRRKGSVLSFVLRKIFNSIIPIALIFLLFINVLIYFYYDYQSTDLNFLPSSLITAIDYLPSWKSRLDGRGRWIIKAGPNSDGDDGFRDDGIENEFTIDRKTGLKVPAEVYPARMNPFKRANATFFALVRNDELHGMMLSMRSVEDRINRKFGYPWVFLNDKKFTRNFKESVRSMTRSKVYFGLIPKSHWSYPDHIDLRKADITRKKMEGLKIPYGGSESYRHMCRYQSGFFFRHPLMLKFDYYWRVEPNVQYYCDLDYDPFIFMKENKKVYGFTISLYEYASTIQSLWSNVQNYFRSRPGLISNDSSIGFLAKNPSKGIESDYNLCHFWSNFEIGDLNFFRSKEYLDFFDHLDKAGGFYYERWGDAPVHSIGVSLLLSKDKIHFFDEIGYFHSPFSHCPLDKEAFHVNGKCYCDPDDNFDFNRFSCSPIWFKISGYNPNP